MILIIAALACGVVIGYFLSESPDCERCGTSEENAEFWYQRALYWQRIALMEPRDDDDPPPDGDDEPEPEVAESEPVKAMAKAAGAER